MIDITTSKGERKIAKILRRQEIRFFAETKFIDCIGDKKQLPFDFSIYNDDRELVGLIEYQGVQHYLPSFGWDDLNRIKNTDSIKAEYCKERGIPLLIVPYYKYETMEDKLILPFLNRIGMRTFKNVKNRRRRLA